MKISKTQRQALIDLWGDKASTLDELQAKIGYEFRNKTTLLEALTHSSAAKSRSESPDRERMLFYERLEFIGDSVLGLIITLALAKRPEHLEEGQLSKIRSAIVNEQSLFNVASELGLDKFILFGNTKTTSTRPDSVKSKTSIMADVIEALVAAVFFDGGLKQATKVVHLLFAKLLSMDDFSSMLEQDYKSVFQEFCQAKHKQTPTYELVQEKGKSHNKVFQVGVMLGDKVVGLGEGRSKKDASQMAAQDALNKLKNKKPKKKRARKKKTKQ